jgi:hypothetical protein
MKNLFIVMAFMPYMAFCHLSYEVLSPQGMPPGSIIITEIMADPIPSVGLPVFEYVELFNPSANPLELDGWTFSLNSTSVAIPTTTIGAGEYIIICGTTIATAFPGPGQVVGVKSFPSLLDNGAIVVIRDNNGTFVHGVDYTPDWHSSNLKEDGGWSLELIDPSFPFSAEGNWTSSVSRSGGTPCAVNSTRRSNPDRTSPLLTNIFPSDSVTLVITFSESISNFTVAAGSYNHGGIVFSSISESDPLLRQFTVTLAIPLERGSAYSFSIPVTVSDFSGNGVANGLFIFALPETIASGDILFNEILFDPWPGGNDFVELVNVSDHCIDASRLLLVSHNLSTGTFSTAYPISITPRCIMPGDYYVVTSDKQSLVNFYVASSVDNIHEVSTLPSLPDDKSAVILYTTWLEMIDSMDYDKSMHFSLLSGTEGISLEKVNPGADSPNRLNWHSAAATAGWATPGAINSLFTETIPSGSAISLSGKRITPDSDGFDDLLVISFESPSVESVLRVTVFTENGYPVRTLADNLYTGYETSFTWDATDDNGDLLPTGIYVILITAFDSSGNKAAWKRAVAILR